VSPAPEPTIRPDALLLLPPGPGQAAAWELEDGLLDAIQAAALGHIRDLAAEGQRDTAAALGILRWKLAQLRAQRDDAWRALGWRP
jgi:hypothetical protein